MFSIIIPFYNHSEYLELCLQSIAQCSGDPSSYEVLVIDNGSSENIKKFVGVDGFNLRVIRNEENLGFPKACNQGVAEAKGDVIILLNSDIIVTPDWLEHLVWHLSNGFDVVGPCTNNISGPQQVAVHPYNSKEELFWAAKTNYEDHKNKHIYHYRVVGFCMACKKELWDDVGGFDEIFSPGNFEDDDFCLRAIAKDYSCGFARDVFVHHFGTISHDKKEYSELLATNEKKFFEKWTMEEYKRLAQLNNDKGKSNE